MLFEGEVIGLNKQYALVKYPFGKKILLYGELKKKTVRKMIMNRQAYHLIVRILSLINKGLGIDFAKEISNFLTLSQPIRYTIFLQP